MELALLLPVVFALLLGVVHAGLVVRDQVLLVHAVREGARLAAMGEDGSAVQRHAGQATPLDQARLDLTVSYAGELVTVRGRYPVHVGVPGLGRAQVVLGAAVTMRVEDDAAGGAASR